MQNDIYSKLKKIFILSLFSFFLSAVYAQEEQTQTKFNLNSYLGRWYEQARLPNKFQKKCLSSSAEYSLNDDGTVKVFNSCCKTDGSETSIIGKATPYSKDPNGRTYTVTFNFFTSIFNFFKGPNYYVYYVNDTYDYAIVGTPQKDYLWILSREKIVSSDDMKDLVQKSKSFGFDVSELIYDERAYDKPCAH